MTRDSPNHYRTLYVQADAPPEVIKAAWRALMSARRVHPDLGGDHDTAVRLNTAYEVLGDPARRAAYDRERRSPTGARPGEPNTPKEPPRQQAAPSARPGPASGPACPFCQRPHAGALRRDSRCLGCNSPLTPLPQPATRALTQDDDQGRRRDPRYPRDAIVQLWLPTETQPRPARLRDLSFSGLQLHAPEPMPKGQVVRVVAPWFEALFIMVACRSLSTGHALHGRLLTLLMEQQARGVYVNAKA